MEQTDRILKQDAAGRVWTPPEQREAVLDEFAKSGMPATQFAARIGVKYSTFASWLQKRRKERGQASVTTSQAPAALAWVEAAVESRPGGAPRVLVVHLPGGARLEVADAVQAVVARHVFVALRG